MMPLKETKENYESKVKRHGGQNENTILNTCLVIVLEGENRKNGKRQYSEVMVEIFPKLMKDLNQEAH